MKFVQIMCFSMCLSDNIWLASVWMCIKYFKSNPTFKLSNNFRQTWVSKGIQHPKVNVLNFQHCIYICIESWSGRKMPHWLFFQVVIQKSMNLNGLGINRSDNSNLQDILKWQHDQVNFLVLKSIFNISETIGHLG